MGDEDGQNLAHIGKSIHDESAHFYSDHQFNFVEDESNKNNHGDVDDESNSHPYSQGSILVTNVGDTGFNHQQTLLGEVDDYLGEKRFAQDDDEEERSVQDEDNNLLERDSSPTMDSSSMENDDDNDDEVDEEFQLLLEKVKTMNTPVLNAHLNDTRYNVVKRCCKRLGWKSVEKGAWSLAWYDCGGNTAEMNMSQLNQLQKINHFPGMSKICQKCKLGLTLNRLAKEFPDLYDFHPKTFCLPKQKEALKHWYQLEFATTKHRPIVIVKPDGGCQGNGIFLTNDLKDLDDLKDDAVAVQQYLGNPYLIDGYKFDLRVYALVTSCVPKLRAFQHEEGLVRFATEKYCRPSKKNLKERYMHLTNYAVNKHNANFKENDEEFEDESSDEEENEGEPAKGKRNSMEEQHFDSDDDDDESASEDEEGGNVGSEASKWSLRRFYRFLKSQGKDVEKLKQDIEAVVTKTILSIQPSLAHEYRACFSNEGTLSNAQQGFRCFEVLGFDIMLDENLRPWIIEVNHSPSLQCGSKLDNRIKTKVVQESLALGCIDADDLFAGNSLKRPATLQEQKDKLGQVINSKRGGNGSNANQVSDEKRELEKRHRQLNLLRGKYEDGHCGGFKRILPVPSDSPFAEDFAKIESYKPALYKESPAAMRRRLAIEEERKKANAIKLRHKAMVGNRPAWGSSSGNTEKQSQEEIENLRRLEKMRKQKQEASSASVPLPRVAQLGPYYHRPKQEKSRNQEQSPRTAAAATTTTTAANFMFDQGKTAVRVQNLSFSLNLGIVPEKSNGIKKSTAPLDKFTTIGQVARRGARPTPGEMYIKDNFDAHSSTGNVASISRGWFYKQ